MKVVSIKNLLVAGVAMIAGVAFCEKVETFEEVATTNELSSWTFVDVDETGASLKSGTPTKPAIGWGVRGDEEDGGVPHTQILSVNGAKAAYVNGEGASDYQKVDMLVYVAPSPIPETTIDDCQIALTVNDEGRFCYAQGEVTSTDGWTPMNETIADVAGEGAAEGAWIRLVVLMDYLEKRCLIAANGVVLNGGNWIAIGNYSQITSVGFEGSAQVDDFVFAASVGEAYDKYAAVKFDGEAWVAAETDGVPDNYADIMAAQGVDMETQIEDSNLTYGQAYVAGVDPVPGASFDVKEFSLEFDSDTTASLTLKFPGSWPAGSYNAYVYDNGLDGEATPLLNYDYADNLSQTKEDGVNVISADFEWEEKPDSLFFSIWR